MQYSNTYIIYTDTSFSICLTLFVLSDSKSRIERSNSLHLLTAFSLISCHLPATVLLLLCAVFVGEQRQKREKQTNIVFCLLELLCELIDLIGELGERSLIQSLF